MRMSILVLSILAVPLAAQGTTGDSLSAATATDTARVNAAVRTARHVYGEVNAAAKAGRLLVRDTSCLQEDPAGGRDEFRFMSDSSGLVRYLRWQGGTDDMAVQTEYYYDSKGRLRFTYQRVNHTAGLRWSSRWYYDDAGALVKRINETEKRGAMPQAENAARDPRKFVRRICTHS